MHLIYLLFAEVCKETHAKDVVKAIIGIKRRLRF